MTGRPSDYTPEIAEAICSRLAEGESLRGICRSDDMPAERTIYVWLERHTEFVQQYARAREAQADTLAHEILEISDDGSRDYGRKDSDGLPIFDSDHVQRSRLRVDARKWFASKVAPKKYGDKVQQEISGPNGGPIPMIEMVGVQPKHDASEG